MSFPNMESSDPNTAADSVTAIHLPAVLEGQIGGELVQTVNARDLHASLQVGKDFSTWIKGRIADFAFVEHSDFEIFEDLISPISGSSKARDRKATEYALTIDMAKELAMVERNEAGKRVRRYFIECERRAKEQRQMSPAEILIAQGTALLAVERQQALIAAKQDEQDHKIAETERRLNQIETATDYFTVVGYARWAKKTSIDLKTAADLGRHATRRANHLGVKVSKIPDPRFGAVSQYPKAVLDFVWDEVFSSTH